MTGTPLLLFGVAVAGWIVGHLVRRGLPYVLGLRDKARPYRHPLLEVATALAFVGLAAVRGLAVPQLAWYVFLTLLLAICATDYLVKLIPDRLTFPGTLVGLAYNTAFPEHLLSLPGHRLSGQLLAQLTGLDPSSPWLGGWLALGGALVGFGVLEAIRRLLGMAASMQVMGMGDSKMLMMIGAFLGPAGALLCLALSFLVGVPHGLVYLRLLRQPHSPFGPPLAIAAVLVLLAHRRVLDGIGSFQSAVLALPLEVLAAGYTALLGLAGFLLWRTRRRAAQYEALIEEDYRQVEEKLDD